MGERRLCKPEVTGSIPVRSIASGRADFAENASKSRKSAIRYVAPLETVSPRFRPYRQGLGRVARVSAGSQIGPRAGARRRRCNAAGARGRVFLVRARVAT
jgi:hypothetical protein